MAAPAKPRLAVWKFASCDGCQLTLLDCEDELLAVAGAVEIANFPEASRARDRGPLRSVAGRGLDHHGARRRAHPARCARQLEALVTIGACATAGGIQALRNFADVKEFTSHRLCPARLHRDAGDLDADRRPRAGRFRAARLPDQQAPAARGHLGASSPGASPSRRPHSVCIECKLQGQCLRHGGARHALPRAR